MKRLMILMVVVTASIATACSIVDPDDRASLRDMVASLPSAQGEAWKLMTMNAKAIQYLNGRPPNDQVGKYECRVRNGDKFGAWSQLGQSLMVKDVLRCLRTSVVEAQYVSCVDAWKLTMQRRAAASFDRLGLDGECRYVWDSRYEPEKLPQDCVDPDAVTIDDTVEALISSETPPPLPGGLPPGLLPVLCPLAEHPDAWGCPGGPSGPPGQTPGDEPGGDH
ncbi:hypothetical protein WMF20_35265 [Sorangium sp. So ce834]|uniref:hypothetical protein n=1 Tax=Sorangium sp. So ce834 TaxID=3133321 RepID=UPI003F631D6E